MTNAEKIRQMDDVQLARFLWIWKINSISAFLANGGYGSMNAADIGSWVYEDAEDTFVCTETYVGDDYIFDQDFNNKADRKTENSSEKPNNCEECKHWNDTEDGCADRHECRATTEDWQDWKDKMWSEAVVTEPTTEDCSTVPTSSKMEQVQPQTCSVNGRPYDCGNCEYFKCTADEPQTSCKTCRYDEVDEGYVRCAYYSKSTEQDEPQLTPNYCGSCKHREVPCGDLPCDVCHGYSNYEPKDEPQTDYTPDCPFCKRYGTEDCLGSDCRHYKTYKDESQTERSE